jgi:hypothetical protein
LRKQRSRDIESEMSEFLSCKRISTFLQRGEAIAVLGMFSEKKLTPADFEILGVFSDELAKELSSLFDAAKFLAIK